MTSEKTGKAKTAGAATGGGIEQCERSLGLCSSERSIRVGEISVSSLTMQRILIKNGKATFEPSSMASALQDDLDVWLVDYNTERTHQGHRNIGKRAFDII